MADNKTNYLAKLLTLLVKRSSNVIRIPIQDLMVDDVGQGFQVYFDQESKELVLSHVPAGSTIYKIENGVTWLTNQSVPQKLPLDSRPLSQEELIAKVWSESAATPTEAESRHPLKNKVVTLTSETMADAELERNKRRVVREIENYQSPQPATSPANRQRVVFAKP
jgi:hypothetical protein